MKLIYPIISDALKTIHILLFNLKFKIRIIKKIKNNFNLNLIDFFTAMEQFIRGKYEARKWIAKEWIPPSITELINDVIF